MVVFMLITVFAVKFCTSIISLDGNLVCICPVYTLLPQERTRRLGDLSGCMDWHMVFDASSVDMHFFFSCRFFLCIRVNLARCHVHGKINFLLLLLNPSTTSCLHKYTIGDSIKYL